VVFCGVGDGVLFGVSVGVICGVAIGVVCGVFVGVSAGGCVGGVGVGVEDFVFAGFRGFSRDLRCARDVVYGAVEVVGGVGRHGFVVVVGDPVLRGLRDVVVDGDRKGVGVC